MSSKDPELIHFATITKNATVDFDRPNWWLEKLNSLCEKEVEITIKERKREKSIPQLALYFGVIIKKYCMTDEQFGGWPESEIDQYLRFKICSYFKTIETPEGFVNMLFVDDIRKYDVTQMKEFIDKVLIFLATEHNITIEDPYIFKMNKYLKERE